MPNLTPTQQKDFSKMSFDELKKREQELEQQIAQQKKLLDEEMERVIEENPESKAVWEESKQIEREVEEVRQERQRGERPMSKAIGEPMESVGLETKEEPDSQKRLQNLREALYTTALENDKSLQDLIGEQTKKEVEELRNKIWTLEKQNDALGKLGDSAAKIKDIRERTKGNQPPSGETASSAVAQKVQDLEKDPQKAWVNSGSRKDIVDMLREKLKANEATTQGNQDTKTKQP